jgi:hypothetical protein
MTTEAELREIRVILADLSKKIDQLLKQKQVECVEPLPDEIEATKEYETAKKNRTTRLVPCTR